MYEYVISGCLLTTSLSTFKTVVSVKQIVQRVAPEYFHFTTDDHCLQFVNEFRYLWHIVTNNLCEDADIKREIHNVYVRNVNSEIEITRTS